MSTRSTIAKVQADGTVKAIYCHSDGYPSYNGKILLEHYQDYAKIDALLAQGGCSSLGAEIGEKHDFVKRPKGVCTFYSRDRGEPLHTEVYANMADFLRSDREEWTYLFNNFNDVWTFCKGQEKTLHTLTANDVKGKS